MLYTTCYTLLSEIFEWVAEIPVLDTDKDGKQGTVLLFVKIRDGTGPEYDRVGTNEKLEIRMHLKSTCLDLFYPLLTS